MSLVDTKKAVSMIEKSDCEIIFAPACSRVVYAGRKALKGKRLFYLSDATYHKMLGYYYNHSAHDQIVGNAWEQNAHNLAEKVIIPAGWAYEDAISFYGDSSDKISILKFGANMEEEGYKVVDVDKDVFKILLVGVDWERKGIDIAIKAVELLNETGVAKFELNVIGVNKPEKEFPEYIHFYGRLNKNVLEENAKLKACYMENDIFLMPTKAECAGIVFAESAMYGIPSFTYATGGTVDYVEDGVTGRCLDIKASAEDFKDAILESITSKKLKDYSINASTKYEDDLNWNVWREKFERLVET